MKGKIGNKKISFKLMYCHQKFDVGEIVMQQSEIVPKSI